MALACSLELACDGTFCRRVPTRELNPEQSDLEVLEDALAFDRHLGRGVGYSPCRKGSLAGMRPQPLIERCQANVAERRLPGLALGDGAPDSRDVGLEAAS